MPSPDSLPPPPRLQDLSPRAARLCLNVRRFCLRQLGLERHSRLLLALSGGADSTALAVILHVLAPGLGLELRGMSVNHGLRPEAAQDQAHALSLCRALGIPCSARAADVAGMARRERLGLEDAGRRLRYALLEEERQEHKADHIVLGHHAADLSEDVLLRLVRGTGWPALGGMPARDDRRHILRPLLAVEPQDLKALLIECGIGWRTDGSNEDKKFRRNRLRLDALPLLRAENPSLEKSVHTLWRLARVDQDYWDSLLDSRLTEHPWQEDPDGTSLTLPAPLLRGLHPAARLRLYMRVLRRHATGKEQARAQTLLALDQALEQKRGNTRFQLPGGTEALLAGGSIRFCLCKN